MLSVYRLIIIHGQRERIAHIFRIRGTQLVFKSQGLACGEWAQTLLRHRLGIGLDGVLHQVVACVIPALLRFHDIAFREGGGTGSRPAVQFAEFELNAVGHLFRAVLREIGVRFRDISVEFEYDDRVPLRGDRLSLRVDFRQDHVFVLGVALVFPIGQRFIIGDGESDRTAVRRIVCSACCRIA